MNKHTHSVDLIFVLHLSGRFKSIHSIQMRMQNAQLFGMCASLHRIHKPTHDNKFYSRLLKFRCANRWSIYIEIAKGDAQICT